MRTRRGLGAVVQSYNFIEHSINSTGRSAGQNTTLPRGQTSLPSWKNRWKSGVHFAATIAIRAGSKHD
jgi:hypothetical protein